LKTSFRLFGIEIKKEISVGDGLVLSNSAMSIPEISSLKTKEYYDGIEVMVQPIKVNGIYDFEIFIPNILENKYSHELIPLQNEVIDDVIKLLIDE